MNPKRLSPLFLALSLAVIATSVAVARPEERRGAYLALGDSVTFGFITQAGFEYINADNFIGFPNYVGQDVRFKADAACPGETTGSFLSSTAPDNGCRVYRAQFPLHVSYDSTQLDFALSFLGSHPETRLVTVLLGANDLFLLEDACAGDPTCIANGLPQVLATVSANMQTILSDIRETGFISQEGTRAGQVCSTLPVKLEKSWWRSHWVSTMIVPGVRTGRSIWLYIAALSIILCPELKKLRRSAR
jgi:hypothetical protein